MAYNSKQGISAVETCVRSHACLRESFDDAGG